MFYKKITNTIKNLRNYINQSNELILLNQGKILSNQQYLMPGKKFNDYEFKIFSQFGDDGLIQYLIKNISIKNKFFIEFGVEDYSESNTRFLMMNNNWSGFVMDGSSENMTRLKEQNYFWKYDLQCKGVFIDKSNINGLLSDLNQTDIGLLHIDLDGNDYWILEELDLSKLSPSILICEYNSILGKDKALTVPYDKCFNRTEKHYSNLYWGASIKAFKLAAEKKGYALVGCNSTGNNVYFVKRDSLNNVVKEVTIDEAYVESRYRESRDKNGRLSFISGKNRIKEISGLEIFNIETNTCEKL